MTKKLQPLNFFSEDIDYQQDNDIHLSNWLKTTCEQEGFDIQQVNYILCSDNYLLSINKEHLNHDYFTDIITFDLSDESHSLEADIFISIDRVKENAELSNVDFVDEYHRVLIHGLLHLMGYNDKHEEERKLMRQTEDKYLALRP